MGWRRTRDQSKPRNLRLINASPLIMKPLEVLDTRGVCNALHRVGLVQCQGPGHPEHSQGMINFRGPKNLTVRP